MLGFPSFTPPHAQQLTLIAFIVPLSCIVHRVAFGERAVARGWAPHQARSRNEFAFQWSPGGKWRLFDKKYRFLPCG